MTRTRPLIAVVVACSTVGLVACSKEQRATTDSAAGAVASNFRDALAVIDIDMGRRVDVDRKIVDETDDFSPSDTIYASVHTSGTANDGAVIGRWTDQNGTLLDEKTDMVTTNGDARTVFFIAKPTGFTPGTYTLHVMIDGKEVRSKNATVN
jgi:hypothetical protein